MRPNTLKSGLGKEAWHQWREVGSSICRECSQKTGWGGGRTLPDPHKFQHQKYCHTFLNGEHDLLWGLENNKRREDSSILAQALKHWVQQMEWMWEHLRIDSSVQLLSVLLNNHAQGAKEAACCKENSLSSSKVSAESCRLLCVG